MPEEECSQCQMKTKDVLLMTGKKTKDSLLILEQNINHGVKKCSDQVSQHFRQSQTGDSILSKFVYQIQVQSLPCLVIESLSALCRIC